MRVRVRQPILSSLRTRLVLLVLLAIVPALGLILYTASAQRHAATVAVQQNLLRLARFAATNQQQANEGARQLLIVLSQIPEIRDGDSMECDRLLERLLNQYEAYLGFAVADAEGNLICSTPAVDDPVNLADRDYFRRAKATRTFTIGDYQVGRITQQASISMAYPIVTAAGEVKGVVAAALDLNWLNQLATAAQLPDGSVLTVTDRNGTIIVRHPDAEAWIGQSFPDHPIIQAMQYQREGTLDAQGPDGVERIYAFTTLGPDSGPHDLYIRIGIPRSLALAEANQLLMQNLGWLALVTLLAIAAAWIGGDVFLVSKLHQLVQTTQQLRRGRLYTRTNLTQEPGEVGMLARAFDAMAATLEMREGAIANLNQDLQQQLEALRQSEQRFRAAQELSLDAFMVLRSIRDEAGTIVDFEWAYANPKAVEVLAQPGQSGQSLVGERLLARFPGSETHSELFERYVHIVETGIPQDIEIHYRADGVVGWFRNMAVRLDDGVAISCSDITQRKLADQERDELLAREQLAREEAETANRIKDEFLAVLSHELRSPLNPILGWARLLQERDFNERMRQQALATIERNARLQTQLVDDLLDVSRILRGKVALSMGKVNLATVIEAAMETVQLAAEAKSIPLEFLGRANMAPVLVLGDSARLQQIVWNLLSNAVKFTPNGGRVVVRLEAVGEDGTAPRSSSPGSAQALTHAQITVSDTGKGITPDFLPHVFDYFRQEDGKTTRRFGGLGLGLAIVRHLTELHGGLVTVDSPGANQGATFSLRLPLLKPGELTEKRGSDPTHPVVNAPELAGLRILVVDDEADTRRLVQVIMGQQDATVKTVSSAAEALRSLDQFQPHLLISDIGMPDMDGYMLVKQVRQRSPDQGGHIPAIALTAYASEWDQRQAIAAGFQRHMTKPIDPNELIQTVAGLVLSL